MCGLELKLGQWLHNMSRRFIKFYSVACNKTNALVSQTGAASTRFHTLRVARLSLLAYGAPPRVQVRGELVQLDCTARPRPKTSVLIQFPELRDRLLNHAATDWNAPYQAANSDVSCP